MMTNSSVVFLLFLSFIQILQLCFCKNSTSACNERERQALLKFRSSFKNTSSGSPLASWEGNDCCQWEGVGCHGTSGPVIKFELGLTSCNSRDCMLEAEVMNPSLMELEHLNHLDLSGIDFNYSPIPAFLGSMKQLRYLDLSHCGFSGEIPHRLGNLSNLHVLDVSHNHLTGKIPIDIGALSSLVELDLSNNHLEGTLSRLHLCNVSNMKELDLGFNNLMVRIDSNWTPPFQLTHLGMASCNIGTQFPQWLQSQKQLSTLDLSNNNICGMIPNWFHGTMFSNLTSVLDLSNNQISGSIPNNFGDQTNMKELILKNNRFESSIPESLCGWDMLVLDLSNNSLSGKIPNCWRSNGTGFSIINLSSNKLSGTISSSFLNISSVSWLNLSNNSLHGEISHVLRNIQRVLILDLGGNRFSGMIPPEIGQSNAFQMLQFLRLSHNLLSGRIPSSLCQLPCLQILDLAGNTLSGSIPLCMCNLSGMIKQSCNAFSGIYSDIMRHFRVDIARTFDPNRPVVPVLPPTTDQWEKQDLKQVLKGLELDYTKNLQYLVNIDLSDNNLTGLIPEGLTCLSGLNGLNLSHNKLSGGIPSKIGKMKSLESVDLSSNLLYGSIPISMSTLTFLAFLNLSNNNFSGPIPKGRQFSTFDPSSFVGNPYLCGEPLSNPCGGDHGTKAGSEIKSDNDEGKEKALFYFVIAVGYITGFWGVIRILGLKRRWRHALFQYVGDFADIMYVKIVIRVARFKKMININQLHQ